jgi:ribonuclease P protein component
MTRPDAPRMQTFGPDDRIRRRSDFKTVQSRGKRVHTPHFVIIVLPRPEGTQRLGITVTRKISPSAVRRNRVKRLVREVFRKNRELFPRADVVFIAKSGAPDLEYGEVLHQVTRVRRAMAAAARVGATVPGGGC